MFINCVPSFADRTLKIKSSEKKKTLTRPVESVFKVEKIEFEEFEKKTKIKIDADPTSDSKIQCLDKTLKLQSIYPETTLEHDAEDIFLDKDYTVNITFLHTKYVNNCTEFIGILRAYSINNAEHAVGTYDIDLLLSVDIPILDESGSLSFDISKTLFSHCEEYVVICIQCDGEDFENIGLKVSSENMKKIGESTECYASAYLNNTDKITKETERILSPCFSSSGAPCSDKVETLTFIIEFSVAGGVVIVALIGKYSSSFKYIFKKTIPS